MVKKALTPIKQWSETVHITKYISKRSLFKSEVEAEISLWKQRKFRKPKPDYVKL